MNAGFTYRRSTVSRASLTGLPSQAIRAAVIKQTRESARVVFTIAPFHTPLQVRLYLLRGATACFDSELLQVFDRVRPDAVFPVRERGLTRIGGKNEPVVSELALIREQVDVLLAEVVDPDLVRPRVVLHEGPRDVILRLAAQQVDAAAIRLPAAHLAAGTLGVAIVHLLHALEVHVEPVFLASCWTARPEVLDQELTPPRFIESRVQIALLFGLEPDNERIEQRLQLLRSQRTEVR